MDDSQMFPKEPAPATQKYAHLYELRIAPFIVDLLRFAVRTFARFIVPKA
jgi:hypothetical protein